MSPEKHNKSEKTTYADGVELSLKEYYLVEKLNPGSPVKIPQPKQRSDFMNDCQNSKEGVYQGLRTTIKAGNEFFGIVDVFLKTDNGAMEGTAITRNIPNERAEFVTFIKPSGITEIGRNHNNNLDNSVSRNHLVLSFNDEGGINIMDMGSANGTKLYRHKKPGPKNLLIENPTDDINSWSLKSAEIKKTMQDSAEKEMFESSQYLTN